MMAMVRQSPVAAWSGRGLNLCNWPPISLVSDPYTSASGPPVGAERPSRSKGFARSAAGPVARMDPRDPPCHRSHDGLRRRCFGGDAGPANEGVDLHLDSVPRGTSR